jgi:hypothetical protein
MGEQIEDVFGIPMNYADHSEVMALLKSMNRNDDFYFGSIDVNGFMVAIYAGDTALCIPRKDLESILDYKTIQVAIYDLEDAIHPQKDDRFSSFDWAKYFSYTNIKGAATPSYMGADVPIEVVPKIVHDVYRVSCLRAFY